MTPFSENEHPEHLRGKPPLSTGTVLVAVGVMLAIAALSLGAGIFVPLVLAILVAFALAPLVHLLRVARLPHLAAVLLSVAVAGAVLGALAYLVSTQILRLASDLPAYQATIAQKLGNFQMPGGDIFERFGSAVKDLSAKMGTLDNSEENNRLLPLRVESTPQSPLVAVLNVVGSLLGPFATSAIVTVFVVFLLLEREDLRDRFLKLVSHGDLQTSTRAVNEASKRVSRYLLVQFSVNITYGAVFGAGLWLIGIPNAILWGILAAIFRYIPFVGTIIAAAVPLLLAFASDPGWSMLFYVIALYVALELLVTNAIEPRLYGSSTGLSPLAVIVAAIFWATLWGPVGLILATPITVCLVVLGRYVPQLSFLNILLGSDPALRGEEKLYQRLLAENVEQAVELGEQSVEKMRLSEFFDTIAVVVLQLAERDRSLTMSDVLLRRRVADGLIEVARRAADRAVGLAPLINAAKANRQPAIRAVGTPVLVIGAKSELDRAAAEMVGILVRSGGIGVQVLPPMAVHHNALSQIDLRGVQALCLCYLETDPSTSIRYIAGHLKERSPQTRVLVCVLNPFPANMDTPEGLGIEAIAVGVTQAASILEGFVPQHPSDPMRAPIIPENEADRLRALERLGLTAGSGRHFDEVAKKVSLAFETPIALVSVIDEQHQLWPGAAGLPPKLDACRLGERETSICGHVVEKGDVIVVQDVAADARFANNPFLLEHGIRFYAGAPLRTLDGYTIGSLCIIDYKPRKFSESDVKILVRIANNLMSKIEMSCLDKTISLE